MRKLTTISAVAVLLPAASLAQFNFNVGSRQVQVHSFASQGFTYSNQNNYLSMQTSKGTFAFTDFGLNVSTQLAEKLRVGAQAYDRNVGHLGNWRPELDWAVAEYRFKDWFGIRAGKVKTLLGLYNDSQDLEFVHTWALMPQSTYPVDVRGDTIAHLGGDIFGNFNPRKLGGFAYTVYGGQRPNDPEGGYLYGLSTSSRVFTPNGGLTYITSQTKKIDNYGGPIYGADLRWTTPLKGVVAGASYLKQDITTTGMYLSPAQVPYKMVTLRNDIRAFYVEYSHGNLRFAGEYRREVKLSNNNSPTGAILHGDENARSGYLSVAYRLARWLELGTYHSRYIANWAAYHGDPMNHIFDQVATVRFDFNSYFDFKVEGHFIDGAMINSVLDRGFYASPNPAGLKPNMNMMVVRLGFHM